MYSKSYWLSLKFELGAWANLVDEAGVVRQQISPGSQSPDVLSFVQILSNFGVKLTVILSTPFSELSPLQEM